MAKKRAREADGQAEQQLPAPNKVDEDESDDGDDMEIVNVDFELFNYDPDIDFHGVKTLLRQLFDVDATLLDLSALSDLILRQNTVGSTCKVDDKANDAYAFLTVLNAQVRQAGDTSIAQLVEYLAEQAKTSSNGKLASMVPDLLRAPADSGTQVGLVLADRLINMPTEIVPPMWKMMVDEIEAAVGDGEPYRFTHYLVVSRTYQEVESNLDQDQRKKKKAKEEAGILYFHPEDEELRKHASAAGSFAYTKDDESVADSKRAFQEMGIKSKGFLMLIEAGKFEGAVNAMAEYVGAPS